MAYSCDGQGIYEARSNLPGQEGTVLFSRVLSIAGTTEPVATTNVSSWSNQCGADSYFKSVQESTGDVVEP